MVHNPNNRKVLENQEPQKYEACRMAMNLPPDISSLIINSTKYVL